MPFQLINRDLLLSGMPIYMVRCEKWNSDRDSHLIENVFLDIESARKYQMELWADQLYQFEAFTGWSNRPPPAGRTAEDYVLTRTYSTSEYVGWDVQSITNDGIMSEDDWGEMNWESDYGLTTGYSIVTLDWDAEKNRYG